MAAAAADRTASRGAAGGMLSTHLPSITSLSSQQTCPASKFCLRCSAVRPKWLAQAPGLQKHPVLRKMLCRAASLSTSL